MGDAPANASVHVINNGEDGRQGFRVLYVVDPGGYHVDFWAQRLWNFDEWETEIVGSLKWDGCMNWSTLAVYAGHVCGLNGWREFAEDVVAMLAFLGPTIPHYDASLAD